jgi:uncharacterized protein (TIGR00375 family)
MFQSGSLFADLHIHSNYCGNLSKRGDVGKLVEIARKKGVGLLGTGDLTNKRWREIVYAETEERSDGFQWAAGGGQRTREFPFILSVEVSCSDKAHHLILLPGRETAESLFIEFAKHGKIEKMGRPFLHFTSRELLETCLKIDEKIEVIPAHVWTPHFGIFGEEAHYGSLENAFGPLLAKKIHAIETGLSSDPEMNRRMGFLDGKTIVSFSDAHSHSLERIGREATVFRAAEKNYSEIIRAIRKNEILGTVEVFPEFGKYHLDGHRGCNVCLTPEESKKVNNSCPKCGKSLTLGVQHRVEDLSTRGRGKAEKPFVSTLPIPEIVAAALGCGAGTLKAKKIQEKFISAFGSEFYALVFASGRELAHVDKKVGAAILACREGRVKLSGGYDGVFGRVSFD